MISFGKPDIGVKDEQAILNALRSGWIGNGKEARRFEEEFGEFIGNRNCVAVNSCTMGLMLSLMTLKRKSRILTSPMTFAATVNAILGTGHIPVLTDVKENGTIDISKTSSEYDVIVPVHYTGTACDMEEIQKAGVPIIEDNAHGFGGNYKGQNLGTIGDFGVFSFYPTKNITTIDGGMVVTKSPDDATRIRIMANQGQTHNAWKRANREVNDFVITPGLKGAMPDINAALGRVQLRRWLRIKEKRNKIWETYEEAFGKREEGHSHHLFTIEVENRDELRKKLREKGIPTGIHYKAIHLEPAYKNLGYKEGDFPNAEKISKETLSLPISTEMTREDALKVVETVKELNG